MQQTQYSLFPSFGITHIDKNDVHLRISRVKRKSHIAEDADAEKISL